MELEHVGIAVKSLEQSIPVFEKLLGTACYKTETVESEQVRTAFLSGGPVKVELLETASCGNSLSRFLEKRGEGIHHIAFEVADIRAEMRRLEAEGFELLDREPKPGADDRLICFLHPKDVHGVLVELCQRRSG
ncbi:MAG TPA: methylmalonyl-CoA epimerase [Chitinophagaceae bacterium]|nr:methylmalonyl-CoA epimerase [Chitinophagaceae bacterium]